MRDNRKRLGQFILSLGMLVLTATMLSGQTDQITMATFEVDVSPPLGSPVAYAPAREIVDPLLAKGFVLQTPQGRIIITALDWIGIANESQDLFKASIAKAAQTSPDKVSVHALHQHDGVRCDHTTAGILEKYGLADDYFDVDFLNETIAKVSKAVADASHRMRPVTHIGFGEAKVDSVASNRRILGPDDKVAIIRWSKSKDPAAINAPEGLIDPYLKSVTFYEQKQPLAVLTYYATHPQSYYGQGDVTCEFVGLARNQRQQEEAIPHIHFTGAAGNIAAGKYNDGSVEMRPVLARRMAEAMAMAFKKTKRKKLSSDQIAWKSTEVALPLPDYLNTDFLMPYIDGRKTDPGFKAISAASHLAWLQRTKAGYYPTISALQLGQIQLLHLPGEIFIEYQLAAQAMKPNQKICTAAYSEYGPGYIGTKVAYPQGGYETSMRASRTTGEAEVLLMEAIKQVLE